MRRLIWCPVNITTLLKTIYNKQTFRMEDFYKRVCVEVCTLHEYVATSLQR